MSFNSPYYFLLLLLIPILIFLGITGIQDINKKRNLILSNKVLKKLGLKVTSKQKFLNLFLYIGIIFFTIISLTRPLGNPINKETKEQGRDIVIALDLSNSMKADDVTLSGSYSDTIIKGEINNVTRLEAAKKVIKGLLKEFESDRVALVIFSDIAFPLVPLTDDYDLFKSFIDNVSFSYTGSGGTNIGDAIEIAKKRFNKDTPNESKSILIISDGEDIDNKALDKARESKKDKIIINTLGIGSLEGSKIILGKDIYGKNMYKIYNGEEVITKLDDKLLKEIANITGGKYFQLVKNDISSDIFKQINKGGYFSYKSKNNLVYQEFFQIFVFIAIFLLFLSKYLEYYMLDKKENL